MLHSDLLQFSIDLMIGAYLLIHSARNREWNVTSTQSCSINTSEQRLCKLSRDTTHIVQLLVARVHVRLVSAMTPDAWHRCRDAALWWCYARSLACTSAKHTFYLRYACIFNQYPSHDIATSSGVQCLQAATINSEFECCLQCYVDSCKRSSIIVDLLV